MYAAKNSLKFQSICNISLEILRAKIFWISKPIWERINTMLFKYPKICWEKNVEKLWHEVGYANSNALIKMRNAAYDTDGIINS